MTTPRREKPWTRGPFAAGRYKGEPAVFSDGAFPGNGTHVVAICWGESAERDRNLFAAAPELVDALEEMVRTHPMSDLDTDALLRVLNGDSPASQVLQSKYLLEARALLSRIYNDTVPDEGAGRGGE